MEQLNGLEGDFETITFMELLWWLHQTQQTVSMRIETARGSAWLFFRYGEIRRCEWDGLVGRKALFALAPIKTGDFGLTKRLNMPPATNIETSTLELLGQCEKIARAEQEPAPAHAA